MSPLLWITSSFYWFYWDVGIILTDLLCFLYIAKTWAHHQHALPHFLSLPFSLFFSHLEWLQLICTWSYAICLCWDFIRNYSRKPVALFTERIFEETIGFISFFFTRAHKKRVLILVKLGIIMFLLNRGFIFMLWTQWIMELIISYSH